MVYFVLVIFSLQSNHSFVLLVVPLFPVRLVRIILGRARRFAGLGALRADVAGLAAVPALATLAVTITAPTALVG